jgi:hypothetical protein
MAGPALRPVVAITWSWTRFCSAFMSSGLICGMRVILGSPACQKIRQNLSRWCQGVMIGGNANQI